MTDTVYTFDTEEAVIRWFFEEIRIMREGTIAPIDFAYAVARKHQEALETIKSLTEPKVSFS